MDLSKIYKIDNVFNEDQLNELKKYASHYVWTLTGYSHDPNGRVFWRKDFMHQLGVCEPLELMFRNKIQQLFNIKVKSEDLYMNGQAHGQCGSLHSDVEQDAEGDYITMVFFPQPEWHVEWGGFTAIIDDNKNLHTVYPTPNSAVIFNSKLPHLGFDPSIHCKYQRVSLAYKMKILKD